MNTFGRYGDSCFWFTALAIWVFLFPVNFAGAQTHPRSEEVAAFFTAIQNDNTNAAAGNMVLVRRLLQLGVDINQTADTRMSAGAQMTALHEAIRHNQPAICRTLPEAGANPNAIDAGFSTPLHLAFSDNREEMAGGLLDYGSEPFQGMFYANDWTLIFLPRRGM